MSMAIENYIDGEWAESETGDTFEITNPANTNEVVGRAQQSNQEDVGRAIEAAVAAKEGWKATPGPTRGKILKRTAELLADRKEELAKTLSAEEGKTLIEARPEVQRAIDIFHYYAEKARDFRGAVKAPSSQNAHLYTVREPLGVVSLITPWNYPIAIPAWKIAPALATGNTVVFKPASLAPSISAEIFECLDIAGLPDGVANYITGPGSELGDPLSTHEAIDAVSFTGSTKVGTKVYEDATHDQKRVQTEMGGKNPAIVMPSANLENAVDIVGSGAFGVTGQACTATSRAIVHESIHDNFLDRISEYTESLEVGLGTEGYDMGPQVSQSELNSTLDYIDIGQREGAALETGGNQPNDERHTNGHFVEPTVFSDVKPDMRIAQEEIFGPILAVIPVSDFEDAIKVANGVQYGLSASIVTNDLTEAHRFVDEIEVGVAKVNEKTTGIELHVPFGGFKSSSSETYREQGDAALDFFTITKTAYMNY